MNPSDVKPSDVKPGFYWLEKKDRKSEIVRIIRGPSCFYVRKYRHVNETDERSATISTCTTEMTVSEEIISEMKLTLIPSSPPDEINKYSNIAEWIRQFPELLATIRAPLKPAAEKIYKDQIRKLRRDNCYRPITCRNDCADCADFRQYKYNKPKPKSDRRAEPKSHPVDPKYCSPNCRYFSSTPLKAAQCAAYYDRPGIRGERSKQCLEDFPPPPEEAASGMKIKAVTSRLSNIRVR